MRISLPQQTLTRPLGQVRPMSVVRHNREHFIVSASKDPSADFDEPGGGDILCLNIQTNTVDALDPNLNVELMEADLTVRDVTRVPGGQFNITTVTASEADEIRAGRKIQAVKMVRDRTSLGVKEAKDIVDAEAARMGL